MTDLEFYTRLIISPCDGCSAYEEIGHCGTWRDNCFIPDLLIGLDNLIDWLGWDKDDFITFIEFKGREEPEFAMRLASPHICTTAYPPSSHRVKGNGIRKCISSSSIPSKNWKDNQIICLNFQTPKLPKTINMKKIKIIFGILVLVMLSFGIKYCAGQTSAPIDIYNSKQAHNI